MAQKATLGQISQFTSMCEDGVYDRAFVQALIEKRVEVTKLDSYRFHVTYAPLPGIATLETRFSGEDSVSLLYDGREWTRHSTCVTIDQTPGEREFLLAEIPEQFLGMRIDDVRDDLAAHFGLKGFRFAIETEAVEFADAQPELLRKNWILALGSSALSGGGSQCVAVLFERDRDRILGDGWVGDELDGGDRVLLVRNVSSAL